MVRIPSLVTITSKLLYGEPLRRIRFLRKTERWLFRSAFIHKLERIIDKINLSMASKEAKSSFERMVESDLEEMVKEGMVEGINPSEKIEPEVKNKMREINLCRKDGRSYYHPFIYYGIPKSCYKGALKKFEKARVLNSELKKKHGVSVRGILENLAYAYYSLGDLKNMIKYYELALEGMDSEEGDSFIFSHLGFAYAKKKDMEKAKQYWKKFLELGQQSEYDRWDQRIKSNHVQVLKIGTKEEIDREGEVSSILGRQSWSGELCELIDDTLSSFGKSYFTLETKGVWDRPFLIESMIDTENAIQILRNLLIFHNRLTKKLEEGRLHVPDFSYIENIEHKLIDRLGENSKLNEFLEKYEDFINSKLKSPPLEVVIHGDLYPTNILTDGTIIDFEKMSVGDPLIDLIYFLENPCILFSKKTKEKLCTKYLSNLLKELNRKDIKVENLMKRYLPIKIHNSLGLFGSTLHHHPGELAISFLEQAISTMYEAGELELKDAFIDYLTHTPCQSGQIKSKELISLDLGPIDLHVHTYYSDGDLSPTEVVEQAAKNKLWAIAITDHDTLTGIEEAIETGEKYGVEIVPGVELSVLKDGQELHILGYFLYESYSFARHDQELLNLLNTICKGRTERSKEIIRRYAKKGIEIDIEELIKRNPQSAYLSRAAIAKYLYEEKGRPIEKSIKEMSNGFARVPYSEEYFPDAKKGISTLKKSGAITFLAHPGKLSLIKEGRENPLHKLPWFFNFPQKPSFYHEVFHSPGQRKFFGFARKLRDEYGLDGLEIISPNHDGFLINDLRVTASFRFLGYPIGGTDYHGPILNPQIEIGKGKGNLYISSFYLWQLKALGRKIEEIYKQKGEYPLDSIINILFKERREE